jgi:hypothetical protein
LRWAAEGPVPRSWSRPGDDHSPPNATGDPGIRDKISGVNRQTALVVGALAALALVAGAAIGFLWHAPGHSSAWDEVRNWLTFAVIFVGLGAALLQLELQRRQLGVLQRDLTQREQILERQQANYVMVELKSWTGTGSGTLAPGSNSLVFLAVVTNESDRPIRKVVARLEITGEPPALATRLGQVVERPMFQAATATQFNTFGDGDCFAVIRARTSGGFAFPRAVDLGLGAQVTARFTDDADLHWQIGHDLHLERLPNRDW